VRNMPSYCQDSAVFGLLLLQAVSHSEKAYMNIKTSSCILTRPFMMQSRPVTSYAQALSFRTQLCEEFNNAFAQAFRGN